MVMNHGDSGEDTLRGSHIDNSCFLITLHPMS